MFCHKCGRKIEDDSSFCSFCGAFVGDTVEPVNSTASSESTFDPVYTVNVGASEELNPEIVKEPVKRNKNKIVFFLIVGAIALVIIGYFFTLEHSRSLADNRQGNKACKWDLLPEIANKIDSNMDDYLEAAYLFEDGKYSAAIIKYKKLAEVGYRESETLYLDCRFEYDMTIISPEEVVDTSKIDVQEYIKAVKDIQKLLSLKYEKVLESKDEIYTTVFETIENAYFEGNYYLVNDVYQKVDLDNFESTQAGYLYYLDLFARARRLSYSITIYNELMENINFAEARDILLTNTGYLAEYLSNKWKDSDSKKIFMWGDEEVTDDFPSLISGYHYLHLEAGSIYVYKNKGDYDNRIIDKTITIIDENTMEMYCYKDRKTYTLYRQYTG